VNPVIERCLRAGTRSDTIETVAQWWPRWKAVAAAGDSPVALAIGCGFAADRVAWAFAAGYQAALRALAPELPADALVAFCVTEESGNRPRDMQTVITHHDDGSVSISGAKRWTTLGPDCTLLLVVGRELDAADDRDARPKLRVACVASAAPGLSLVAMPPTRFVPEVPHARVYLAGVRLPASALLPGDGYDAFVKPFRTLEDTHVTAAALAYLLREACARAWPASLRERIVSTLCALAAVAAGASDAPASHVALEGALRWAHHLYDEAAPLWEAAADEAAARWQRDAPLFAVAGAARVQRAGRAWERLASEGEMHG